MKNIKTYHFWFEGQENFNKDNPYSSINGSLITAQNWAVRLLVWNSAYKKVFYQAENGKTVYFSEIEG